MLDKRRAHTMFVVCHGWRAAGGPRAADNSGGLIGVTIMTYVLATTIVDGELDRTERTKCADLAEANALADRYESDDSNVWIGCVHVGDKIKRVF